MKPQDQISRHRRARHGKQMLAGRHTTHPAIEQAYHADARDFHVASARLTASPASTFRQLSREFFATETKRDYVMEAICFVILVTVSAWPIVAAVRALSWLT